MFPPQVRANLFEDCLNPLWEEIGVDVPAEYRQFLKKTVVSYTQHNPNRCRQYIEAVNAEILPEELSTLVDGNGVYHEKLIATFYSRVGARIVAKIRKKRKILAFLSHYFTLGDDKLIADIMNAIIEEIDEVTNVHTSISMQEKLKVIPKDVIRTIKYENTWFKDVDNNFLLDVIDVLTDTEDKISSGINKGMQMDRVIHPLPKVVTTDTTTDHPKAAFIPGPFQINGIVLSIIYLGISIFTPLYKKYVLKRDEDLINRWSMRYFIPSLLLLVLGIVAFNVAVVGMYAGFVFAAYSLASNILKVSVYFYYYKELNKDIEKNTIKLQETTQKRKALQKEISQLKTKYKLLSLSAAPDTAKACADKIQKLEEEYQHATVEWLSAECDKEELNVKKIITHDKTTGALNILRLATVLLGISGTFLVFFLPAAPVGAAILLATFCLGTALLITHYANKFRLKLEEKSQAKEKKRNFAARIGESSPTLSYKAEIQTIHAASTRPSAVQIVPKPKEQAQPAPAKKVVSIATQIGLVKGIFAQQQHQHVKTQQPPEANSAFSM